MAEALAVAMLLLDAPSFLAGHAATFYIDNLPALSRFIMGYSQIAGLSGICRCCPGRPVRHARAVRARSQPFEHRRRRGQAR
eukprot:542121-Pyramimonas_sp.AAC.1